MDWAFLARHLALYTVLGGGAAVGGSLLLPAVLRPYALLGWVAVGLLLLGRAMLKSGRGTTTTGGTGAGSGMGLAAGGNDTFAARDSDTPAGAGPVFFAFGLVVFGILALVAAMPG